MGLYSVCLCGAEPKALCSDSWAAHCYCASVPVIVRSRIDQILSTTAPYSERTYLWAEVKLCLTNRWMCCFLEQVSWTTENPVPSTKWNSTKRKWFIHEAMPGHWQYFEFPFLCLPQNLESLTAHCSPQAVVWHCDVKCVRELCIFLSAPVCWCIVLSFFLTLWSKQNLFSVSVFVSMFQIALHVQACIFLLCRVENVGKQAMDKCWNAFNHPHWNLSKTTNTTMSKSSADELSVSVASYVHSLAVNPSSQ